MTRIAVIGAGSIGGTLGDIWQRAGHEVVFGVRHPEVPDDTARRVATPEAAIVRAEIVVFAIPGGAVDAAVRALGPALRGRIIIDATNRIGPANAYCESLQDLSSDDTPVYRAFNSLGWENFQDPRYGDEVADLFYAGPDEPARGQIEALVADVGLRPVYVGTDPSIVDGVLRLWFALALHQKMGRHIAFKLLTR